MAMALHEMTGTVSVAQGGFAPRPAAGAADNLQLLGLLMSQLPAAAWIKDLDGRYVFANAVLADLVDWPAADVIGKTDHDLFPDVALQLREHDKHVLQSRTPVQFVETIPRPGGPHNWLSSKFPIVNEAGKLVMIGGVAFDVTDGCKGDIIASENRYPPQALLDRTVDASARESLTAAPDRYGALSAREREVLDLIMEGLTNASIAARLSLSRRTVEAHRANLMRKLGVKGMASLVRFALLRGA